MRLLSDGWHAAWGGAIDDVSQNPGYYDATAVARCLHGLGRDREQPATCRRRHHARGHQARLHRPRARGRPAHPCRHLLVARAAHRRDGDCSGLHPRGRPPATRPQPHIPALHLPSFVQMMAEAAQSYGIVVRDQTHSAIGFWIQDPAHGHRPSMAATATLAPRGLSRGCGPMSY